MKLENSACALLAALGAALAGCSGQGSQMMTPRQGDAAMAGVRAAPQTLPTLGAYNVDRSNVIVAGVSSGADMATQIFYSHSSKVKGEATFAGAPFFCAQDNALDALYLCAGTEYGPVPVGTLEADTNNASCFYMDCVADLRGRSAWIFSGLDDTVVAQSVAKSAQTMDAHYGVNASTNYTTAAAHGWVTPDTSISCGTLGSPFLINCGFDAEQQILSYFFGTLKPRNNGTLTGKLIQFNQSPYAAVSMDSSAYIFVPANCASGSACKLVVALHGCEQGQSYVGTTFVTESGLNEWADTNSTIVLYPQAVPSGANPDGCWDWWGYGGSNYSVSGGVQVNAIWSMMQRI
jgi:poly(3-hydroxybutyrate) depolymerase